MKFDLLKAQAEAMAFRTKWDEAVARYEQALLIKGVSAEERGEQQRAGCRWGPRFCPRIIAFEEVEDGLPGRVERRLGKERAPPTDSGGEPQSIRQIRAFRLSYLLGCRFAESRAWAK